MATKGRNGKSGTVDAHVRGKDFLTDAEMERLFDAAKKGRHVSELRFDDLQHYCERAFSHVAEAKNVDFLVRLDPRLPKSMVTDTKRLQQILDLQDPAHLVGRRRVAFADGYGAPAHLTRHKADLFAPLRWPNASVWKQALGIRVWESVGKKKRAAREVGPSPNCRRCRTEFYFTRGSNCGVLSAGAVRDGRMLFRGGNYFLAHAGH